MGKNYARTEAHGVPHRRILLTTFLVVGVVCITATESLCDSLTARTIQISAPLSLTPVISHGLPQTYKNPKFFRENVSRMREHHVDYRPVPSPNDPRAFFGPQSAKTLVKPAVHLTFDATGTSVFKDSSVLVLEHLNGVAPADLGYIQHNAVGPVAEPSVATRGDAVLITANWSAFLSTDGGKSFGVLDPYVKFGSPTVGEGFCCDQVATYDPRHDMTVWLLQGVQNTNGNTIRLLVSTGANINQDKWVAYDLDQGLLGQGSWRQVWFDFPDLVVSNDYLYLTMNLFPVDGRPDTLPGFPGSFVARIPLADLAAAHATHLDIVSLDDSFAPRVARGNAGTAYWATHGADTSRLRVFSWPENSLDVNYGSTTVEAWLDPGKPDTGAVSNVGINRTHQRPWLARLDGRITAAWQSNGRVGFAWSASQDPLNGYKQPHVRVAIVDPAHLEARPNQPNIWSDDVAFAYPSVASLPNGEIGIAVAYGGGKRFPSTAVGILVGDQARPSVTWDLITGLVGQNAPKCKQSDGSWTYCGFWGDYTSTVPFRSSSSDEFASWATIGFAALNPVVTNPSKSEEALKMGIAYIHFSHKRVGPQNP